MPVTCLCGFQLNFFSTSGHCLYCAGTLLVYEIPDRRQTGGSSKGWAWNKAWVERRLHLAFMHAPRLPHLSRLKSFTMPSLSLLLHGILIYHSMASSNHLSFDIIIIHAMAAWPYHHTITMPHLLPTYSLCLLSHHLPTLQANNGSSSEKMGQGRWAGGGRTGTGVGQHGLPVYGNLFLLYVCAHTFSCCLPLNPATKHAGACKQSKHPFLLLQTTMACGVHACPTGMA